MINLGRYNKLKVNRLVDFGAYLDAGDGKEVLMPAKYADDNLAPGDEVEVFVYTDSEDRYVATTEKPFALVGEFAFLQVTQVNRVGAFLDWGLDAKDLLVPFSEQKDRMREGGIYLVYIYVDHTTQRVVASEKIEKFLGNVLPHYTKGQAVTALPYQRTPLGYKCIVDNLHYGMIYANEVFKPIVLQEPITAYVKQVREDNKIDLLAFDRSRARTRDIAEEIEDALKTSNGFLPFTDKSDPEAITSTFQCSKRDFKKAIGKLYKEHRITLGNDGIYLKKQPTIATDMSD